MTVAIPLKLICINVPCQKVPSEIIKHGSSHLRAVSLPSNGISPPSWSRLTCVVTYIDETASLNLWHSPGDSTGYQYESRESPPFTSDDVSDGSTRHASFGESDVIRTSLAERHGRASPSHRAVFPASDTSFEARSSVERSSGTPSASPFSNVGLSQIGDTQLPTPARSVESAFQIPHGSAFPQMNQTEAELFRHFVQRLAICVSLST